MRQLQFVGVSDDGAQLLFRDPASRDQFQVPLDDRLRAASRNDRSRLGQIELELSSTLRPREIQARIRAGETPEEVAAAAQAPLQRVMRFAYPVLQEREQVTVEARRTRIRRSDSASRLGDQVEDRLQKQGIDPDAAEWDAFRRDDGTWWVTLRWRMGEKTVAAHWSFDLPGRTLTPADDVAAELQAEQPRRRPIAAVPFVPDEVPDPEYDEAAEYRDANYGPQDGDYAEHRRESYRETEYRDGTYQSSAHPARRGLSRRDRPMRVARVDQQQAARPEQPRQAAVNPDDLPPGPVSVVSAPQRRSESGRAREYGRTRERESQEQAEAPAQPQPPVQPQEQPRPAPEQTRVAPERAPANRPRPQAPAGTEPTPTRTESASARTEPAPPRAEPAPVRAEQARPQAPARTEQPRPQVPAAAAEPEPGPSTAEQRAVAGGVPEDRAEPAEEARAKSSRARKPKVPSWDDIVFGTRGRK